MNRMMRAAAAAVTMAGGLGGVGCTGAGGPKAATADPVARGAAPDGGCVSGGCATGAVGYGGDRPGIDNRLANLYDPSWPERYSYVARQETLAPFAIQVGNSVVIESTMWNRYFVPETDTLNAAGLERLDYLSRKRPAPNARVYLQTAHDLTYDATKPDKFVTDRVALNEKRAQAVQRYLAAQTAARPVNFEVAVIDPIDATIPAVNPANAVRGLVGQYRSGISGATSTGQSQSAGGGTVGTTGIAVQSTGGAPTGGGQAGTATPSR